MKKKRIAVIGGGVGAMTAAWSIASDPALRERHEITVYQMGWRLGGKGASGRQRTTPLDGAEHDAGHRILEHGLHVWAGFYDNAFRSLGACYRELNRLGLRDPDAPLGTIQTAFEPLEHLFLAEKVAVPGGTPEWRPWLIDLPTNDLVPGTATEAPGPFAMALRMLQILQTFLADHELSLAAARHLGPERHGRLHGAHDALHRHAAGMGARPKDHSARESGILVELVEAAQHVVHDLQTPENLDDDPVRRTLFLMDLSLAAMRGMATSDVFTAGYDVLDQWEFTGWLRHNGAGEHALDSVLLRGCYDFVFGFPHGRALAGDVGAGTALRAMGRMLLSYRGAVFWKMRAGMGDTIFAPYYQALSALGVTFRFFNAARALVPDAAGTRIERIEMVEQARPLGGSYNPLIPVRDLPCWPSEPLWDRLEDGEALKAQGIDFEAEPPEGARFTLEAGRDFDEVILGASMGSLPYLTEGLSAASARWRRMLGSVRTVGTHAAQFWLREGQDGLGWRALVERRNPRVPMPDGPLQTVITGFGEPLDTWADMTHLLDREDWGPDGPKSIAYFCSPAPDGETLEQFTRRVRRWASEELTQLWTGAEAPDHKGFAAADLWKPKGVKAPSWDAQYYRVNMTGSERYVLSVTGSVFHRLAPDESGFANLTLAGDWTRCGLNAGCVEAATMSGIAAASAVTGVAMLNVGADDIAADETAQARAMYKTSSVSAAPWPISGFFARGELNGWFLFWAMPRAEVRAMLPRGLHLAPNRFAPKGFHPVGLSLSRFHDVRGSFVPDKLAMAPYGEASFAIPFVSSEETGRARFLYPHRLYVDSLPAIAAGRIFYAMDKVRARLTLDDRGFAADDPSGRRFIESRFEQHDDPAPLRDHPAFGTIAALLNLPFVTVRRDGKLLFNAFNLELDRAWAAPVSGHVTVDDPQPGGYPRADLTAVPLGPDHPHGLPGAVRIWTHWSMTNPLDGRRIRDSARAEAFLRGIY